MPPLSSADEPALGNDLPWLEALVAHMVSGHVPDQSVEKQYFGAGVEAPARRGLFHRLAGQAQAHAGDGRTRGGPDLAGGGGHG